MIDEIGHGRSNWAPLSKDGWMDDSCIAWLPSRRHSWPSAWVINKPSGYIGWIDDRVPWESMNPWVPSVKWDHALRHEWMSYDGAMIVSRSGERSSLDLSQDQAMTEALMAKGRRDWSEIGTEIEATISDKILLFLRLAVRMWFRSMSPPRHEWMSEMVQWSSHDRANDRVSIWAEIKPWPRP